MFAEFYLIWCLFISRNSFFFSLHQGKPDQSKILHDEKSVLILFWENFPNSKELTLLKEKQ